MIEDPYLVKVHACSPQTALEASGRKGLGTRQFFVCLEKETAIGVGQPVKTFMPCYKKEEKQLRNTFQIEEAVILKYSVF